MLRAVGLIALIYLFFNYLPEILETADKCLGNAWQRKELSV